MYRIVIHVCAHSSPLDVLGMSDPVVRRRRRSSCGCGFHLRSLSDVLFLVRSLNMQHVSLDFLLFGGGKTFVVS